MDVLQTIGFKKLELTKDILSENTLEIIIKTKHMEEPSILTNELVLHQNNSQDPLSSPVKNLEEPPILTNELVLHQNDSQDPLSSPIKLSNDNPWAVSSFKEFLWYNCPECEFKNKNEEKLYQHAIKNHCKAQQYYAYIKNEDIRSEITEQNNETVNIENKNTSDINSEVNKNIKSYQYMVLK